MRIWLSAIIAASILAGLLWVSDKITFDSERTIYTASCQGGTWQGESCNGQLVAADRYLFRVVKAHRQVSVWTAGANKPLRTLSDCDIRDGQIGRAVKHAMASPRSPSR